MKKQLFSVLLAGLLLVSVFPAAVHAEDAGQEPDIAPILLTESSENSDNDVLIMPAPTAEEPDYEAIAAEYARKQEEKDAALQKLAECEHGEDCAFSAFSDLEGYEWAHDGIHYCAEQGYMIGVGEGQFNPAGTVTRAELAVMLWRYAGEPYVNYAMQFEDVPAEDWYTEAVRWTAAENLISGTDEAHFSPKDTLTREEVAIVLYAYACKLDEGFRGASMFYVPFTDLEEFGESAFNPIRWCYMKKVMIGKEDNRFDPKGTVTRAEMAAILQRFAFVF